MKICQFKTDGALQQRLGILIGDDQVCDVAELARAVKSAGSAPADWLGEVNSTLDLIRRGSSATAQLASLLDGGPHSGQGRTAAYSVDSITFLPAVYPSKIL